MKPKVLRARLSEGGLAVDLVAVVTEGGVALSVTGGDLPHIGAVALAEPRQSRRDPSKTSSSVSVITRLGHKEDALAARISGTMASRMGLPVVVSAGIHIDDASPADIRLAVKLAETVAAESVPRIRSLLHSGTRGRKPRSRSPS